MKVNKIYEIDISKKYTIDTYSGYKKIDVINKLKECIEQKNVEDSFYFAIELFRSLKLDILLNILFNYYLENIHINNIKLFFYLNNEIIKINSIKNKYNDQLVRNYVASIMSLIINSNTNINLQYNIKISKNDFEKTNLINIIKHYLSKQLIKNKDYYNISLYEIEFQLNKNNLKACQYWVDWYLYYITKINKDKELVKDYINQLFVNVLKTEKQFSYEYKKIQQIQLIFNKRYSISKLNKLKSLIYCIFYIKNNKNILSIPLNNNFKNWLKSVLYINILFNNNIIEDEPDNSVDYDNEEIALNNENILNYRMRYLDKWDFKKKESDNKKNINGSIKNYFNNIKHINLKK